VPGQQVDERHPGVAVCPRHRGPDRLAQGRMSIQKTA
jgi:hypothetical protein